MKVFWSPADLEERRRQLDWDIKVQAAGASYLNGIGRTVTPEQ